MKGKPIRIDNHGRKPWNKGMRGVQKGFWAGKKRPDISVMNIGKKRPEVSGEKNKNWKGDNVGYIALHAWVKKYLGRADKCTFCSSTQKIQWANKSQKYRRDLSDWIKLCSKCHFRYDKQDERLRDYHGRFLKVETMT